MLKTLLLVALSAPPVLLLIAGCAFHEPTSFASSTFEDSRFYAGEGLPKDVIFCDVEVGRACATPTEIAMGVDIAAPFKDGLLTQKSTRFGLDYSSAAIAACGGPRKVQFKGAFPEGSAVGLDAATALGPGLAYENVTAACVAWCESHEWEDGNGGPFPCAAAARPSAGFLDAPVNGAATPAGILRFDFKDLRRATAFPVEWRNLENVALIGTGNGLRKTAVLEDWVAGASSVRLLNSDDGFVEFTATETNRRRMAGFAIGADDTDSSLNDIAFAVSLEENAVLVIYESGARTFEYGTPYKTGDIVRVAATGGVVRYFLNGALVYTSTETYGGTLRVSASLFTLGASLGNVKTSF